MLPSPIEPAGSPNAGSVASRTEASAPTLAQARTRVLAMFRTGRELVRWSAVSEYVDQAYVGVEQMRRAAEIWGDLTRSYRMHDLAKALVEVGAVDQAIAYAERATLLESDFQAERAGQYWCELLHKERPHDEELAAQHLVFDRWPSSENALALAQAADENSDVERSSLAESVYAQLETQHPRELINTLLGRGLADRAWEAAERLTTDPGL
jgi:hypothetical protein